MDEPLSTPPEAVFEILTSSDQLDDRRRSLAAEADDHPGVQCELAFEDLTGDPYDAVLRSTKLNSRWGSDLSSVYRESIRSIVDDVESDVADALRDAFEGTNADPYEAEVTGEALTMGFDVPAAVREKLDAWDELTFNEDDLAAALAFAADREALRDDPAIGTVVLYSETPFSELLRRNRSPSHLPRVVQSLLLLRTNVRLVAPQGRSDERDIVDEQFRQIGSFSIDQHDGASMELDEHATHAIDAWYDRLCYNVEHKRVAERVVRPASVTAYDLPPEPEFDHFVNAITVGLQNEYSQKRYDKERFDRLWREHVTPHDRYNQYRSERQSFPRVTVARDDDRTKVFRLHHEGPNTQPRLNGTPIRTDDPERELVDLIVRFLDAETTTENTWTTIRDTVDAQLATDLSLDPDTVAEYALLRSRRVRTEKTPLLPPFDEGAGPDASVERSRDEAWYREHWATILSGYRLTKGAGVNVMAAKKELCHSLDPDSRADRALFYKLQTDLRKAWEHYPAVLEEQLRVSLPDELEPTVETDEQDDRTTVNVTVRPPDADPMDATITVFLPYSDVRVNGTRVSRATVSNTVASVLETFEDVLYVRREGVGDVDTTETLYDIIRVYCSTVDAGEGDLVYFDEIVEFCLSLPDVWQCFQRPNSSLRDAVRDDLGREELIRRLRDRGVRFHRKGSDDHGSVKVSGDQYIAMELRTDDL